MSAPRSGNHFDSEEFGGRVAVVTGASSGIGLAVAQQLVARGAEVHGTSRRPEGLHAISDIGAIPQVCDVTSPAARTRLAERIGPCDMFVSAAGDNRIDALDAVTEEDYRYVMEVNLHGPFFLTQDLARRMPGGSSIVLVSSTAAKRADPETAVYAAAKAGLQSLTRSFALALADRQIRVNAVAPKIIATPMQRMYVEHTAPLRGITPDQLDDERLAQVPLRRPGTPDECADVIMFLLSSRSSYVTGQTLNVDGGWLME